MNNYIARNMRFMRGYVATKVFEGAPKQEVEEWFVNTVMGNKMETFCIEHHPSKKTFIKQILRVDEEKAEDYMPVPKKRFGDPY